jgi:hypothetical protein
VFTRREENGATRRARFKRVGVDSVGACATRALINPYEYVEFHKRCMAVTFVPSVRTYGSPSCCLEWVMLKYES